MSCLLKIKQLRILIRYRKEFHNGLINSDPIPTISTQERWVHDDDRDTSDET